MASSTFFGGGLPAQGPGGLQIPGSLATPLGLGGLTSSAAPGGSLSMKEGGTQSSNIGGSFFSQPDLVAALAQNMGGVQGQSANNYSNFINNPTAHPAFTNALSGLLGALVPSENASRTNLMDMFRGAGNTASSTFGQKAQGLESEILRNRQTTASQLLASLFPQISGALFAPLGQTDELVNALKLSGQMGSSGGTDNAFSLSTNAPTSSQLGQENRQNIQSGYNQAFNFGAG